MVDFDSRQQVEGFARLLSEPGINPMEALEGLLSKRLLGPTAGFSPSTTSTCFTGSSSWVASSGGTSSGRHDLRLQ